MLAAPTLLLMFTIPETLQSQVLLNKAKRIRRAKVQGFENVIAPVEATDRTLLGIFKVAITRPWIILFDTISLLCAIYLSVVYALLYMLFSIYPIVFQEYRGWNAGVGELPLIGTVVGAVLGGAFVFYVSEQHKKRVLAGETLTPEDRLGIAKVGGILFPVTMFWFAWTGEYPSVHWIVPTIAGALLSTSIMLIFVAYLNYLTDSYLMFAASALAANTVARSACGAAAPLFTNYMFTALGVGGGGSLIGGVAILLAPIPFVFARYGAGIRKRSKFAPTDGPETMKKPEDEESGSQKDRDQSSDEHTTSPKGRKRSIDESSTDEKALDEEAGVPSSAALKEAVKEYEDRTSHASHDDRYLDASGLEKAERA